MSQQRRILQFVSLQANQCHSLNSSVIDFMIRIDNITPTCCDTDVDDDSGADEASPAAPTSALAFPGGWLRLHGNRLWQSTTIRIDCIAPQANRTCCVATRPTVGFKNSADLDVEARFDLFDDAMRPVECSGTNSTDGSVWQKCVAEFAGDIVDSCRALPAPLPVALVGAVGSGKSSLVNLLQTTMSFGKQFQMPSVVGRGGGAAPMTKQLVEHCVALGASTATIRVFDTPGFGSSGDDGGETTTPALAALLAAVRTAGGMALFVTAAASLDDTLQTNCNAHAFNEVLHATAGRALLVVSQLDRVVPAIRGQPWSQQPSEVRERVDRTLARAQVAFGVPRHRIFPMIAYDSEVQRTAIVEQPAFALLHAMAQLAHQ